MKYYILYHQLSDSVIKFLECRIEILCDLVHT